MAPSSNLECHVASISIRNTFVYASSSEDDLDDVSEQPCLLRAKTAPTSKAWQAESPKVQDRLKRAQFSSVVEETLYSEEGTSSDGVEGHDDQDASPKLMRCRTRDSFESPMAWDHTHPSFESIFVSPEVCPMPFPSVEPAVEDTTGMELAAMYAEMVPMAMGAYAAASATGAPMWMWDQHLQIGDGAMQFPFFVIPAMFPSEPQPQLTVPAAPSPEPLAWVTGSRAVEADAVEYSASGTSEEPLLVDETVASDQPQPPAIATHSAGRREPLATRAAAKVTRQKPADTMEGRTTVMLRNLPNNYTRENLLNMIDSQGFAGKYDFIYFPIDFRTHAALGYAFLNLVTPADAEAFRTRIDGFSQWRLPSSKVCSVGWSHPHQGLESHIHRYRNSPLMHASVPDAYRPVLFSNGNRVQFPPPTKKIKPPRQGTERMLV